MDNASSIPTIDTNRRLIETGTAPILACLPDVSADVPIDRTAKKAKTPQVGYRFDPPQMANRETQEDSHGRPAQFHTLKSELIYSPRTSRPLQPHVFERARATQRHTRVPHRESPILPRTNPFANPRRGLIDAIVPVLRFATLVALFTAAGTWLQMTFHNQPVATPTKSPKATVQHPAASAAKTVDRPVQPPTAVGPVGTTPESGTKVGRVRENDDFARLRGDILPVKPQLSNTSELAPAVVGSGLPHVQLTELPHAGGNDDSARSEDLVGSDDLTRASDATGPAGTPEVARLPDFLIGTPSR